MTVRFIYFEFWSFCPLKQIVEENRTHFTHFTHFIVSLLLVFNCLTVYRLVYRDYRYRDNKQERHLIFYTYTYSKYAYQTMIYSIYSIIINICIYKIFQYFSVKHKIHQILKFYTSKVYIITFSEIKIIENGEIS